MKIHFYKYQGAGNDFVIIDNRNHTVQLSTLQIERICDRRFGIGADGLMYVEQQEGFDFKMVYFNADGKESTMCGNGGRCIVLFAKDIGLISASTHFNAIDGAHTARLVADDQVALGMIDVDQILFGNNETILNTGSPHYVCEVAQLDALDVYRKGKEIRNESRFGAKGINVNFVEKIAGVLHIRTYERGVEDETYACGTGVTAAAISSVSKSIGTFNIDVIAKGGAMNVTFTKDEAAAAKNIVLTGPAAFVFEGDIEI